MTTSLVSGVTPSTVASVAPPAPSGPAGDNQGAGAGSWGFLVIIGLIVVSIGIFLAMNRSLLRARRNLGGEALPRRRPPGRTRSPAIPTRDDHESTRRDGPPPTGS